MHSKNNEINSYTPTGEMNRLYDLLEQDYSIYLITGKAGTGKSSFLKHFVEQNKHNTVALAPTGVAAMNISGQTIHSFFHFPHEFIDANTIQKSKSPKIFQAIDYLIIDEMSMLRPDIFDAIDQSLRKNRNSSLTPFGGVKILLFGDLFQLPPVVGNNEHHLFFQKHYNTEYFFSSAVFKDNIDKVTHIELTEIFRQQDPEFVELINDIRAYNLNDKIGSVLDDKIIDDDFHLPDDIMILCTTNKLAEKYNRKYLDEIDNPPAFYEAEVEGKYSTKDYPTNELLELKVGAKVVFIKNDPMKRWINGTIGYVHKQAEDYIRVKVGSHIWKVERSEWIKYSYKVVDGKIEKTQIGSFTQLPLKYGWALTVHKSQGLTLDNILLDTERKAFAPGQIYVALSRVRSLDNIYLKNAITTGDIIGNRTVTRFYNYLLQRDN